MLPQQYYNENVHIFNTWFSTALHSDGGEEVKPWVHNSSKKSVQLGQNPRRQKGDIKQVLHWGPTNISRHHTKFSRHGDLAHGISN